MSRFDTSDVDSRAPDGASRRSFLKGLGVAPAIAATATWTGPLGAVTGRYGDDTVPLLRTKGGRRLSRVRFHRAVEFSATLTERPFESVGASLYHAGIAAQLGLSAHLLDIGFPDDWCARHIGLRVAKSLDYANATGFGHDCPDMARLAAVLTPYWVWRHPPLQGDRVPDDGGFTREQVRPLILALLERVQAVTGHSRPRGRRGRQETRT